MWVDFHIRKKLGGLSCKGIPLHLASVTQGSRPHLSSRWLCFRLRRHLTPWETNFLLPCWILPFPVLSASFNGTIELEMHQLLCSIWLHQQSAGWISVTTGHFCEESLGGAQTAQLRRERGYTERISLWERKALMVQNQGEWLWIMSFFDIIPSA